MASFEEGIEKELVFQVHDVPCSYSEIGWQSSTVGGEVVFRHAAGRLQLVRLGLAGASPGLSGHPAHKLALSAYAGSGELSTSSEDGLLAFELVLPAAVACNTNPGCTGTGLKSHALRGTFAGAFRKVSANGVETLVLVAGRLELAADAVEGAAPFGLAVALAAHPLMPLASPPATRRQVLKLQPVQHRTGGKNPTGTMWPQQLAVAQQIWDQCCMQLDPQPMITVDDATAARSSDDHCTQLKAMTSPIAPDAIPIFYIDNPLSGDGGGWTDLPGSGADAVFLSSQVNDDTVLAHELGHVLGGDHPAANHPVMKGAAWAGSANTILVPGNGHPSPKRNSGHNCSCARHCLLKTQSEACAFTPDLP